MGDEGNSSEETKILVNKAMIQIARDLRQRQTPAEVIMWEALRDRRLADLKFRRQHPIPKTAYVVDFYCHSAKLVVEIDGGIHKNQQEDDAIRQANIEAEGYTVLRIKNEDVYTNLEDVLMQILDNALTNDALTLNPSPEGRGTSDSASNNLPSPVGEGQGVRANMGDEGMKQRTYKTYDTLVVNDTLTLTGIPPEVFDYRLGNRSALEWVVDQYRVKTDKRSGITSDPNQYSDDERYIVDLVEKIVTVSLETVKLVDQITQYPIIETAKS